MKWLFEKLSRKTRSRDALDSGSGVSAVKSVVLRPVKKNHYDTTISVGTMRFAPLPEDRSPSPETMIRFTKWVEDLDRRGAKMIPNYPKTNNAYKEFRVGAYTEWFINSFVKVACDSSGRLTANINGISNGYTDFGSFESHVMKELGRVMLMNGNFEKKVVAPSPPKASNMTYEETMHAVKSYVTALRKLSQYRRYGRTFD